jgi:5-methylcytosine-specific restriction endonuclease McrA
VSKKYFNPNPPVIDMGSIPSDPAEYRVWYQSNLPKGVEWGECWCGCGEKTTIPTVQNSKLARIKGQPMRFISSHHKRVKVFTPEELKEHKRAADRAYYRENKQQIIDYVAIWKRENSERVRESNRASARRAYQANPEKFRLIAHEQRLKNPEAAKARDKNRRRAVEGPSGAVLRQMYDDQQGLCAYCDTPLFGTYHVDHILPICLGGTNEWNNLAIVCPPCNLSKHKRRIEDFINDRVR